MSQSVWLLILATVYWVLENRYFGWNWSPQSPEEVIADGIVVLLCGMAVMVSK